MKNKIIFLILLFPFYANSQAKITENEKHVQVGLVWGVLKYHHPEVSQGTFNWDTELINLLKTLDNVTEQEVLNNELLQFIRKFDKPTTVFKTHDEKVNAGKLFKENISYKWIEEIAFSPQLKAELTKLKSNHNIGDYYASSNKLNKMIEFNNEKGLVDFNPLDKNHRILELNSFWNIIQYWDVNKYLTNQNWVEVLSELTNVFLHAETIEDYEIAKLNMFAKLNDSHSYQTSKFIHTSLLKYWPPFRVEIINDSIIVTAIYNKPLAQKDNINLGDVIVGINGLSVTDYIKKEFSTLISSSNETYLRERLNGFIMRNNVDSIQVQILVKTGQLDNKTIKLYKTYKLEDTEYLSEEEKTHWKKVSPKITYINLGNISSEELSKAFKENKNDSGIILDLRNYPRNLSLKDFSKLLYPDKREFIKVLLPLKHRPSMGEYDTEAPLKIIADPFKVGKKNSNYYKGKIVLLVNRKTGSMAEYFGMAIQQAPDCITIGGQTMGAVMNITSAILPDKQEFYFTGIGAFYPNGESVQRKGLRIDHYIKESALNYDSELYIKEAIKIIEDHK